jgi:hypothetical protein
VFTLKVSDQERAAFNAAADRAGKSVSQRAREALVAASASH